MSIKQPFRALSFLYALLFCSMFATSAQAVPGEGTKIMISAPSEHAVDAGKAA